VVTGGGELNLLAMLPRICYSLARADKVGELLETLAALGQVREVELGSFVVEGRIACAWGEAPPRPYDKSQLRVPRWT
jgi:hypothetical protein